MTLTLGQITAECREVNIAHGWRTPDGGICPGQTWGDYIALLHSEIGEALEAYRDHRLADATPVYECPPAGCYGKADCSSGHDATLKPEGVGSEFADVLIRLVDMMDAFGKPLPTGTIAEVVANWPALPVEVMLSGESFGGWMAWLHHWVDKLWLEPESGMRWFVGQQMLAALAVTADHFGIELEAEYVRKTAYNRTRPYQHGGRTLAGDKGTDPRLASGGGKTTRKRDLLAAMPDDPRGWWTFEEVDRFLNVWSGMELPGLVTHGANGEALTLWCTDVHRAAALIDMADNVGNDEGFTLTAGEYEVCVVQAQTKEIKNAHS